MSELTSRINSDMKEALRAGDKVRLQTIRMLMAAIKQQEIDGRAALDDAGVLAVIGRMIKQRRDAEEQYRTASRFELAQAEAAEIEQLTAYLPQPLTPAELDNLVDEAVSQTGASGSRDMGKVMAWLRPRVAGRADMTFLSGRVKTRLG